MWLLTNNTWDCLQTTETQLPMTGSHPTRSSGSDTKYKLWHIGEVNKMSSTLGQNLCQPFNSMESFHAIEWMTCQPSIKWNGFQAITSLTNHPCYYYLHISKLLQGCIFHFLTGRRWLQIRICVLLWEVNPGTERWIWCQQIVFRYQMGHPVHALPLSAFVDWVPFTNILWGGQSQTLIGWRVPKIIHT